MPILAESEEEYSSKLGKVINSVVPDLTYIAIYNSETSFKVKKLLGAIAELAPYKPNITSLATVFKAVERVGENLVGVV